MSIKISAESRSGLGKEAAKKVRNAGMIPAVFYGFGAESQPVSLNPKHLEQALANPKGINGYFSLDIDGKEHPNKVLLRELQRHPVSRQILHIDIVCPFDFKSKDITFSNLRPTFLRVNDFFDRCTTILQLREDCVIHQLRTIDGINIQTWYQIVDQLRGVCRCYFETTVTLGGIWTF